MCSYQIVTAFVSSGKVIRYYANSLYGRRELEKQEKCVSVECPRCKGIHTINMLLERPTAMGDKDFTPSLTRSTDRQLGAILVCPRTRRKFHTSIVLKCEDCWDIKISEVTDS